MTRSGKAQATLLLTLVLFLVPLVVGFLLGRWGLARQNERLQVTLSQARDSLELVTGRHAVAVARLDSSLAAVDSLEQRQRHLLEVADGWARVADSAKKVALGSPDLAGRVETLVTVVGAQEREIVSLRASLRDGAESLARLRGDLVAVRDTLGTTRTALADAQARLTVTIPPLPAPRSDTWLGFSAPSRGVVATAFLIAGFVVGAATAN